ncbi:hypothetical protein Q2440_25605, partial [Escherichia coli]|nr:hypothetical protein [Escherichia coli]
MCISDRCGTAVIASLFSQAALAADSDIADLQTKRLDFSNLQSMADGLAQTAGRGAGLLYRSDAADERII